MIITIHIRHPLLLSLLYNIIINFPSVQCLFVTHFMTYFGLHVCKVVFDQVFSSLPSSFTLYSIKHFHPSPPRSQDLGCAFKQNLFIPPFVQDILVMDSSRTFPPFVQDILAMDSSKTFPPCKTFLQNTEGLVE